MTVNIIEFPRKFLKAQTEACYIARTSITSANPWTRFVKHGGPIDERWVFQITLPPLDGGDLMDEFDSLFDQGNGISGFYSLFLHSHRVPLAGTGTGLGGEGVPFSDDSTFSDGSKFSSGFASCTIGAAAVRGANTITLSGLVASQATGFAKGNMLSIVKSGGSTGFLHRVIANAPTDSSGAATVQIAPPLREGVSAGQSVRLKEPRGVFQMANAEQAYLSRSYNAYSDPHPLVMVEAPEVFTCSL